MLLSRELKIRKQNILGILLSLSGFIFLITLLTLNWLNYYSGLVAVMLLLFGVILSIIVICYMEIILKGVTLILAIKIILIYLIIINSSMNLVSQPIILYIFLSILYLVGIILFKIGYNEYY